MTNNYDYLLEIRRRLILCLMVFALVFIPLSFFANYIYTLFALPLMHQVHSASPLIATTVPGPFLIPFKSALILSLLITMPYFLYQLWVFISPALYSNEKKFFWLLVLSSAVLFYLGMLFAYFIVLPMLFKFFLYIAPLGVEVKPDMNEYFDFVVRIFFAFAFAFELPILILLLINFGIMSAQTLKEKRPYVIVGAFIVGMLLTPPDVVSQTLLAIPLWLLYECGILMAHFCKRYQIFQES